MIVVAIIGVIASIALPAYQDYTAKAQASEGVVILGGLKTPVVEAMSQSSLCAMRPGTVSSGKYVASVSATPGTSGTELTCTLVATFRPSGLNSKVANTTITMVYSTAGAWACTTTLPPEIAPRGC